MCSEAHGAPEKRTNQRLQWFRANISGLSLSIANRLYAAAAAACVLYVFDMTREMLSVTCEQHARALPFANSNIITTTTDSNSTHQQPQQQKKENT